MTTDAIRIEHVTKHYGTFRAVDDLTFHVNRGELFALLGPNGSGKTTTIRMILDILRPDSGRIAVLGGPLSEATKNAIGYLPEERGLYRDAKVLAMMTYLATLKGLPNVEARRRASAMLERLGMAEHANSKVSTLSKGMQQKVQFAVTVMHEPELIIIDEPFSGLDPVNAQLLKDLLFEMRDRGCAVVMSTHQMQQVEEMAERLLMIHKGQLRLYGGVEEVRRAYAPHAVLVEGDGDFAALPGVVRVVPPQGNGRGNGLTMLYLHDDISTDTLLSSMAATPSLHLRQFQLATPSLNDIFIQVAVGTPEPTHA